MILKFKYIKWNIKNIILSLKYVGNILNIRKPTQLKLKNNNIKIYYYIID